MAVNIDDIVRVDISIENPVQTSSSFGVLMLMGPEPNQSVERLKDVSTYANLDMLLKDGYQEEDAIYNAAKVAFAQEPTPTEIFVCIREKGADGEYEPIETTMAKAMEHSGWYGLCAIDFSDTDINKAATLIEKTEKIFSFTTSKIEPVLTDSYLRTHAWFSNQLSTNDTYLHVAVTAKCLGYDPGSEVWAMKSLNMITPSQITSEQAKKLDEANMNYYVAIANANVTQNGKMSGNEWIDIIRFRDWQKNDMQLGIYNFMRQRNKLPYSDAGITAIDAQMIASLQRGVEAGGIAADDYDSEGNKIPGYSTSVPAISQITAEQKQSRRLPGCKWSAKLTGAIQAVEIKGTLSY